jgi:hypothetical protein
MPHWNEERLFSLALAAGVFAVEYAQNDERVAGSAGAVTYVCSLGAGCNP